MNLSQDAMLVILRIAAWPGVLHDRKASSHVAAAHDADIRAGRYHKRLLPKSAFAALTTIVSDARATHYAQTMPWDEKGCRLLTVANYEHYKSLMDAHTERMVQARSRFIEEYETNIERARFELGKLFRIEDYPSRHELRSKFAIRYRFNPVQNADHFMARLAAHDTDRIKHDIERQVGEQLRGAVGDLYRRFGEAIGRVSERLQEDSEGKPRVFRNSLIENIRELVDLTPRLNIFGDDELARLCEQVKQRIASVEPDQLRPSQSYDPEVRARVKADADALAKQFAGYFGEPESEPQPKAAPIPEPDPIPKAA